MDINQLTIGEARSIAALFGARDNPVAHPFIGRYCVIRTYSAGVHVGVLQAASGREVILAAARRIWSWTGAFSLSEVAKFGITGGKVSCLVAEISLTEAVEIIPTTQEAEQCLRNFNAHQV